MIGRSWLIASFALSIAVHLEAQSCSWIQFPNTLIYGGTANPAANIPACQGACLSTPGCQSIDFSTQSQPGSQCFLLFTQNNKFTGAGVVHYDLNCSGSSALPGSTGFSQTLPSIALSTTFPIFPSSNSATPGPPVSGSPPSTPGAPPPTGGSGQPSPPASPPPSPPPSQPPPPPGSVRRDCRTSYEIFPQTSSLGADPVPEIRDVLTCYNACVQLRFCFGFDFSQSTGCWIHSNASDFAQTFYQSDVTQFRLNKCPEDGIEQCIPIPNVDFCDRSCFPKWARYENTAGLGGQSFTNYYVNAFSDCLEACFDQTDCIGIEWTGFPGSNATCTYYSTSQQSAMTSTSLKPFVTQYRLTDRCGRYCQSYWPRYTNYRFRAINASVRTDATNIAQCDRACRLNTTCKYYQYTTSGPFVCTLADDFYEGSNSSAPNIVSNVYRLTCNGTSPPGTPIPPSTTPTVPDSCMWVAFNNTNIYGGQSVGALNLSACWSSCRNTTGCQGVDWTPGNPAGQQCYLLFTQNGKNSVNWNVTHYDLYCNVTTGSLPSTFTAISQYSTTPSTDPCVWVAFNNTNIFGGQSVGASNLSACWSSCRNTTGCQGVDWTPGNAAGQQCYLLSTQNGKNSANWNVTHYDLNCNSTTGGSTNTATGTLTTTTTSTTSASSSTTTSSTSGVCSFVLTNNTIIYGGLGITVQTLDQCKAACLANASCQSIDWSLTNPPGQRCFLLSTQNGKNAGSNVEHYDRICKTGCTWSSSTDMNVFGGTSNPANDLNECQAACLGISQCVGVDFVQSASPGQRCFTFTFPGAKYSSPGVTHYDLTC